jgi:flagellar assembly protein FliH
MSARVLPAESNETTSAIVWRIAEGAAPVPSAHHSGAGHAVPLRSDAKTADAALIRDWEHRVQASHQEGYAAGLAAGTNQANDRLKPVLASFAGMIQELSNCKKQFRLEAEASTVGLALAVARRVLYREITADPEAILGLVKAAFDKCNARETHRLLVSPADLAVIQDYAPRMGFPAGLTIQPDATLSRGSVLFETSRGDLDASIDTQLLEIERGFTDIMRRRPT